MDRQYVSSSNLRSVGYDAETETLEIQFNSSGIFQYYNVPERIYEGLMNASSKGSYLHTYIKHNYHYRKVG